LQSQRLILPLGALDFRIDWFYQAKDDWMKLATAKQLSISLGIYRPVRALHSLILGRHKNLRHHQALLSEFVNPGDLAFDVGANIGNRTDLMLRLGANIVAFEPQPDCAREVRARGGGERLTVVETAVGSQPGFADLFLSASSATASLRPDWERSEGHGKLTVPVTTLDLEIAKWGVPVFCKIDVEGYEAEVLKGLSTPIKALSMEYHCDEPGIAKVAECLRLLARLDEYEFNLTGTEEGKWLSPRWMDQLKFLSAFPDCAKPHFYGDIFARRRTLDYSLHRRN
jgi:FkbM family methyltransferase